MADMDLKDADADKYSTEEAFVPGSSILSDHIKSKVGSVGANDVAFYLVGRDPGIARSFRRIALECEHRSRYHEIVKKFFWPVTVVFFNSLALYLLSRPRRTLRQTLACNLYLQGFWLLPGAAYFALDHFAQRVEPLAVASDVVEVALLATYLAHACRVFKFTHNMGLGRQVLAWLGGTIAQLVLTVLVVGPAVDWVSRYLP
ncbi:MAG TPA: hypothetical protein VFF64_00795 [Candidatus Eremiobacteraceae bacterium]|nr:hypothetical protein [Candidatus Eremiobacteraceae bacterium]